MTPNPGTPAPTKASAGGWTRLRWWMLCLFGGVMVGGLLLGLRSSLIAAPGSAMASGPGVVAVEQRDFDVVIKASGVIRPISQRALGTIASGIIEGIYFEVGDKVVQGQRVASVAARRQEATVKVLRQQLGGEMESLNAERLELDRAKEVHETRRKLYASGHVSKADLDLAQSDLRMAESRFHQQQALVRKLDVELSSEAFAYEQRNIIAPISGTVLSRTGEVGSVYLPSAGSNTILTLADLSRVRAELWFSETDIRQIAIGQDVRLNLLGETGAGQSAVIARVQPEPQHASGVLMFLADVELDNADGRLMSGMSVRAEVLQARRAQALVVPLSAIHTDVEGQSWVLPQSAGAGVAVPQSGPLPVQVVLQDRTHAAVTGEVRPGMLLASPYPGTMTETGAEIRLLSGSAP